MEEDRMTLEEFTELSQGLRQLAADVPLHWGGVQNNRSDSKINMFDIFTYDDLKRALSHLPEHDQQMQKRRWYLWQCARCDEFLFYHNGKSVHNPNRYDKSWDVRFVGGDELEFDIKGTVVPRDMRANIEDLIINPMPMIKFYYDKQSRGVRYDMQNRLFIVHHSFVEEAREFYLRCAWQSKEEIYDKYADEINNGKRTFEYKGCQADVIFILERERNKVEYRFCYPQ